MKGRTDEGDSDRSRDVAAVTASRRGGSESLSDGKHGNLQGGLSSPFSLRASCPGLVGTAGYGPVRPVVWDPWLAGRKLSQSRGPDSPGSDLSPTAVPSVIQPCSVRDPTLANRP